MSEPTDPAGRRSSLGAVIDGVLANPLVGLSPWIVYSLVEGEGRLEESSAIAFGLALAILMAGWLRGSSPKLLEFSDVVFFGALAIFVAVASDSTHAWLERWSGEVANLALVAIAVGSILIRQPFTLAYAKEQAPRELWTNPVFLRTNYVLTWVWAIAFMIEAASGLYGDAVLARLEQPLDRLDHPDAAADRRRAVHALVPRPGQGARCDRTRRGERPATADRRLRRPGDAMDLGHRRHLAGQRRRTLVARRGVHRRRRGADQPPQASWRHHAGGERPRRFVALAPPRTFRRPPG